MNHTLTLRPAFTPFTIVLMVILFMVAWPLGLLMLAYLLWGDRLSFDGATTPGAKRSARSAGCFGWNGSARTRHEPSGNVAFDEYRRSELKRLEEERRRLDEERAEFEARFRHIPVAHSPLTYPIVPARMPLGIDIPLHPGAERYYREHGHL